MQPYNVGQKVLAGEPLPIVPGFKYDLFVSYAHRDDQPWNWVSTLVSTLKAELERKGREFSLWWDPTLRTGQDFNLAIADAISESAVFLCVLSSAYGDSTYCKQEVAKFREQRHPAFDLLVGSMSRMQGIVIESSFTEKSWPPELRTTDPCRFFSDTVSLFSRPQVYDDSSPWVRSLWKVRDSIWAALEEMQRQRKAGVAVERSYASGGTDSGVQSTVYLADVTDDLYDRRESLRSSLSQIPGLRVVTWDDVAAPPSGLHSLSVHLLGQLAGKPVAGGDKSLPRLQLEGALAGNPARRPLVWLVRDVNVQKLEGKHGDFLRSLAPKDDALARADRQSLPEIVQMDFEDLKEEVANRMRPAARAPQARSRQGREDPIVHIWYRDDSAYLAPVKQLLQERNCGISAFNVTTAPPEKLQSRLAVCDGLVVPYTAATKAWAEEVMTEAFRARRGQDRPIAFAALELPPPDVDEFNFEHPRVVSVRSVAGEFRGIDAFLSKMEQADV